MRAYSVGLATLLLGLSQAQGNIPGLPTCAGGCIGNFGGCGTLDANCICNNDQLITNLACCVSVSCNEADQETTLLFAQGICASYNADLPATASCAPGAQSTPMTGSATAAPSSTAASESASSATTTASNSDAESSSAAGSSATNAAESSASAATSAAASASESAAGNAGVRNERIESGLGLGLVVAGLLAAL